MLYPEPQIVFSAGCSIRSNPGIQSDQWGSLDSASLRNDSLRRREHRESGCRPGILPQIEDAHQPRPFWKHDQDGYRKSGSRVSHCRTQKAPGPPMSGSVLWKSPILQRHNRWVAVSETGPGFQNEAASFLLQQNSEVQKDLLSSSENRMRRSDPRIFQKAVHRPRAIDGC